MADHEGQELQGQETNRVSEVNGAKGRRSQGGQRGQAGQKGGSPKIGESRKSWWGEGSGILRPRASLTQKSSVRGIASGDRWGWARGWSSDAARGPCRPTTR